MNRNATILAEFVPCEDITAFELALVVANLAPGHAPKHGIIFGESQWEELDTRIKRHFVRVEAVKSNQGKNLQAVQ